MNFNAISNPVYTFFSLASENEETHFLEYLKNKSFKFTKDDYKRLELIQNQDFKYKVINLMIDTLTYCDFYHIALEIKKETTFMKNCNLLLQILFKTENYFLFMELVKDSIPEDQKAQLFLEAFEILKFERDKLLILKHIPEDDFILKYSHDLEKIQSYCNAINSSFFKKDRCNANFLFKAYKKNSDTFNLLIGNDQYLYRTSTAIYECIKIHKDPRFLNIIDKEVKNKVKMLATFFQDDDILKIINHESVKAIEKVKSEEVNDKETIEFLPEINNLILSNRNYNIEDKIDEFLLYLKFNDFKNSKENSFQKSIDKLESFKENLKIYLLKLKSPEEVNSPEKFNFKNNLVKKLIIKIFIDEFDLICVKDTKEPLFDGILPIISIYQEENRVRVYGNYSKIGQIKGMDL